MKKRIIYFSLISAIITMGGCKKEESIDDQSSSGGVKCDGFSVQVSHWGNNYNAEAVVTGGESPYSYRWSNGEVGVYRIGSSSLSYPLDAGTYSVTVTDNNNCIATDSILIGSKLPVITNSVSCVNDVSGFITFSITDEGNSTIIEKGVCYSTSPNPTILDTKKTSTSTSSSSTVELTPLSRGTNYYARAYAKVSGGVSYASQVNFTTNSSPSPFTIGQSYQGGTIFYIDCSGLHGYITTSNDLGFKRTWVLANDYCNNYSSGGYSDWYMPDNWQMQLMYSNLHQSSMGNFNTGSTIYDNYWSSSRVINNAVCGNYDGVYRKFSNGTNGYLSVCYNLRFRPVRNF